MPSLLVLMQTRVNYQGSSQYTSATAFDPSVTEGIFTISCIVPIIGLTAVALALFFLYPLNKKRVEENVAELARRRGEK